MLSFFRHCRAVLLLGALVASALLLTHAALAPPELPSQIGYYVDIGDDEAPSCWEDTTPSWMLTLLYAPDTVLACYVAGNTRLD